MVCAGARFQRADSPGLNARGFTGIGTRYQPNHRGDGLLKPQAAAQKFDGLISRHLTCLPVAAVLIFELALFESAL